ncbi:MAG: hypothetical protein PHF79_01200 [Candidatus Pacebacteria bacterium]|nr:hypothetical protein [Candidatus Paceibacterota bacterium]
MPANSFLNQGHHHTYILENTDGVDFSSLIAELFLQLEKNWDLKIQGNPDVWSVIYERFGVDESRELINMSSLRSVAGGPRIFVLAANVITTEAQNALLKLLEEPALGTYFFILTSSASRLLPTVLSRAVVFPFVVDINKATDKNINPVESSFPFSKDFLKSSHAERLAMVKKITGELEKEKIQKSDVSNFIKNIEKEIYQIKPLAKMSDDERAGFALIDRAADYSHDRSSSAKLLLEAAALFAPQL